MNLKDLNGLLIIDWWQETDLKKIWSQRIKLELDNLNFETVLVANYETRPSLDDPCQYNTIEQYGWHDYQPKILAPMLKESSWHTTNRYIKTNYGLKSFSILNTEAMGIHLERSNCHIKNWLVVGGAWKVCAHLRPMGFRNLIKLPYNFFVTNWSIYRLNDGDPLSKQEFDHDDLPWTDLGNQLYKLGSFQ